MEFLGLFRERVTAHVLWDVVSFILPGLVQNVINVNEKCLVSTEEQPMETPLGPALLPRGQVAGMASGSPEGTGP